METSRRLFNLEGLQATALYKVAADVGISAGNLSYHFKTKAELAGALADRFEEKFRRMTEHPVVPADADSFIHMMQRVLTLLWQYRFFFSAPQYLAGVDDSLATRFRALRSSLRDLIRQYAHDVIEAGGMRRPPEGGTALLADNIVAVWIYWLQMEGVASQSDPDDPDGLALRECLDHHFGLLEPYLSASFAKHLHDRVRQIIAA